MKKSIVFCILKVSEDSTDPHPDPDPLVRGTNLRIQSQIRTKMQYFSTGRRPGSADRCRGGDEEDERGHVPADAGESSSQG